MAKKIEICRQAIQRDIRKNLHNNQENGSWIVDANTEGEIEPHFSEDGTVSFVEFDEGTGEEIEHVFDVVLLRRANNRPKE